MLLEEIIASAAELTGENSEMLSDVCGIVFERLSSCLKENITAEDCGKVFVFAAAITAADIYKGLKSCGNLLSYSAGSVSVTRKNTSANWEELFLRAEKMLSQYIDDSGFAFVGVDG